MTKRILITGATAGIGLSCAEHLAAAGHFVIATGRNADALRALQERATVNGWRLRTLHLDVTDPAEIVKISKAAAELCRADETGSEASPGIDVLINNAGLGQAGFLADITSERLRDQFDVSFFGLFDMVRAFLPQLRERRGIVLNLGSIMGHMTAPWMGAYGAVKAAVRSLSDTMRVELAALGIRVVLVEPGSVETSFHSRVVAASEQADPPDSPHAAANRWLRENSYKPLFLMRSIAPAVIARLVGRIVTTQNPRPRYITPFAARLLLFFQQIVPTVFLDSLKRRVFHVAPTS